MPPPRRDNHRPESRPNSSTDGRGRGSGHQEARDCGTRIELTRLLKSIRTRTCGRSLLATTCTNKGVGPMKLYRVNKLAKVGGAIIKKKHILAPSDTDAVEQASDS